MWELKVIGLWWDCKWVLQNTVVFYGYGTVASLHSAMKQKNGWQQIHMHLQ